MMVWLTDGIVCSDTPPGQTEAKAGADQNPDTTSIKASGFMIALSFFNRADVVVFIQTVPGWVIPATPFATTLLVCQLILMYSGYLKFHFFQIVFVFWLKNQGRC
jgi:hypothetical protein